MKVDNLLEKVISFCSQNDSEIFNLIKEICLIPAPSGKVEKLLKSSVNKGLKIVAETIINYFK